MTNKPDPNYAKENIKKSDRLLAFGAGLGIGIVLAAVAILLDRSLR